MSERKSDKSPEGRKPAEPGEADPDSAQGGGVAPGPSSGTGKVGPNKREKLSDLPF